MTDVDYRGAFARDLGMAYQITKKSSVCPESQRSAPEYGRWQDWRAMPMQKVIKPGHLRGIPWHTTGFSQPWTRPRISSSGTNLPRWGTRYTKISTITGTSMDDIAFGQQGQAYPTMGVASAVLYDYTNPNNLSLSSTPADWHRVGTEYLFENDLLHTYGRSLFSFGFDEVSGKYLNGAYKSYVMDDFALWFQVSNHVYGENLLDTYPAAKKGFTSEVWESLPNQYSDNYVTNGNTKWIYHKAIISLLPDNEKSMVLNHLDRIEKSTLLPYSSIFQLGGFQGGISSAFLYCVYGNYAALPRTFPATTSHLDPNAITQLFRGSWNDDADWLSLITFNKVTRSNRDMQHHDQLSFEYYSRGDLLLADGGEDKSVLDAFYGTAATSPQHYRHRESAITLPGITLYGQFSTGNL